MKKPIFLLLAGILAVPAFAAEPTTLPLRDVTLFSSGVGYFGRSGKVSGDTDLELRFKSPQLSDILKSLVLLDPMGQVRPVFYSLEESEKTKPTEADLALRTDGTLADVLRAFQGADVTLETRSGPVSGRIVSVSGPVAWPMPVTYITPSSILPPPVTTPVTVQVLTLWSDGKLKTVTFDEIRSVNFTDTVLDEKLKTTLEKKASVLTAKLDDGLRGVKVRFSGKGEREVSVAYLRETPVWKTSYRLILEPNGKPFIQGWAVVENTSDEDWRSVNLHMVSGRPISFIQNMSTPLYIIRPQVQIFSSSTAAPQIYSESLAPPAPAINMPGAAQRARDTMDRMVAAESRVASGLLYSSNIQQSTVPVTQAALAGSTATVTGEDAGDLFSFSMENPFSLERGKAAMIPILGGNIGGELVTVVNSRNSPSYLSSYNGFLLANTTKSHLPTGPITVFSGGTYAGDALTSTIAPGETRLLSYALDLNLSAKLDRVETPEEIRGLSVSEGKLYVTRANLIKRCYLLRNKDVKPKKVILIQPEDSGYKLSDPKQPKDKSAEGWRFHVEAKPKDTTEYLIQSENEYQRTDELTNLEVGTLKMYAANKVASPAVKKALEDIIQRRNRWKEVQVLRASKDAILQDMVRDQDRIRNNMHALNSTSALRRQYEQKLEAQEPKVDALREELAKLRDEEAAAEKEFGSYSSKVQAF